MMSSFNSVKITVPKKKVLKMLKAIKQMNTAEEISFEFIVGSLFPTIYNSIITELNQSYTKGYLQGLRDGEKNENPRINS